MSTPTERTRTDLALLFGLGAATLLVHLLTGGRYGFNRDELAILDDARHLAWGYVSYPPLTPLLGRISLLLFGTSLTGFRFFSALLQAMAIVLTGLIAREMGGGRASQLISAAAAVPFGLAAGALMQYISLDYFFWVLTACWLVKLLNTGEPRYFLLIGISIGLGMLAKYTMLFFAVGVLAGLLLTGTRKYFRTVWPWLGFLLSLLLVTPNFLWQVHHHFVTYDFLHFIHTRDIAEGLTRYFVPGQFEMTLLSFPLWIAGVYFCGRHESGRKFRPLLWMYVVPFAILLLAKGRDYYLAPAYPMLYAAGAVYFENWATRLQPVRTRRVYAAAAAVLSLSILGALPFALPLAPAGSSWFRLVDQVNVTFRDEIGWKEFVATLANVRDSLPAAEQAHLGILVENYGEVGAVNLYGPARHLPTAISGVNSSWARGFGNPAPQTLIVVGFSRDFLVANFDSCRLAAQVTNSYGVVNEETTERKDIYLCGPPRLGWPAFWRNFQYFA
ncbi:MAG TPA: glycosyltransferase family 39 protein [Candidatus Eisenbacteria bacterium]|nr:glycosyltransferase family 39 protein [Candidatus Eisenbacteria bacterium]